MNKILLNWRCLFFVVTAALTILLFSFGVFSRHRDLFAAIVVLFAGLHFVHGSIFNTKIYMAGYILSEGKRLRLRKVLLVGGVLQVFLFLHRCWQGGSAIEFSVDQTWVGACNASFFGVCSSQSWIT